MTYPPDPMPALTPHGDPLRRLIDTRPAERCDCVPDAIAPYVVDLDGSTVRATIASAICAAAADYPGTRPLVLRIPTATGLRFIGTRLDVDASPELEDRIAQLRRAFAVHPDG